MKTLRIIAYLILISANACNLTKTEKDGPVNKIYQDLSAQMEGTRFSPLEFSRGELPKQDQQIFYLAETDKCSFTSGCDTTEILYQSFNVNRFVNGKSKKSGYSFKLHYKNNTSITINEFQKPSTTNDVIVFNDDRSQVRIELSPFNDFIKWHLISEGYAEIDSISVRIETEGPFFGGGERFISSNLNGRMITNQPMDHYRIIGVPGINMASLRKYEPAYIQILFIMTPGGQGWYFDDINTMKIIFDKDGKSFEVNIPGNEISFYTFNEETPKEVLKSYTSLIGRQPALPDWAMGVWVNLLEGRDSVYSKVQRLKKKQIPATAVWLFDLDDPQTSTGFLDWSKGYYGNIRTLTDYLHNSGLKVLTYLRPFSLKNLQYYKFDNPVYKRLDSASLIFRPVTKLDPDRYMTFIEDGQYDIFNPEMYNEWYSFVNELLIDDNFDGWMEDFGDLGYIYDKEEKKWITIPYEINHDISAEEYFNVYPLVYHRIVYEIAGRLKKDVVAFCRSGFAGSAPYTRLLWGGDQIAGWDKEFGYPTAIVAGISSGLSGYGNWAPDILCDSPSRELWMRWVQFAAFTPLMRDHLWSNQKSSIDLWTDDSTMEYFRHYADVHKELMPYLRELADEYQISGVPIIRHMLLEFPGDDNAALCEYQYMLGNKLLVAPVTEEGAETVNVYFPAGIWKDFWTTQQFRSQGSWISVKAPLNIIPVFERVEE